MADIDQYNKVTEVLNASKLPDDTLPIAEQLKDEIAEYNYCTYSNMRQYL